MLSAETVAAVSADPAELYARHRAWLVAHCARRLRSRNDAEDAVQQTFVYALACLARGVEPRDEAAWLRTIADNVCRAARRRPAAAESPADPELLPAPERGDATAHELARALAELPPTQRRALLLREWQGLSYREIAERLETSESAVEALLVRARRRAAALIADGRRALDLGSALSAARSLLATAAGKAGAAAVVGSLAVGAAAVTVPRSPHRVPVRPARTSLPRSAPSRRAPEAEPKAAAAVRPAQERRRVRPAAPRATPARPTPARPTTHVSTVRATPAAATTEPRATAPPPPDPVTHPTVPAAPAEPAAPAAPEPPATAPAPAPPTVVEVTTASAPAAAPVVSTTTDTVTGAVDATTSAVETTVAPVVGQAESTASAATATVTSATATVTSALPTLPKP
jgi:RNA polymerase sigma factor (sigma-70 family)